MAAKVKKETSRNTTFAKGGTTPMFSEQAAEPMPAGHTGDPTSQDNAPGDKYACGGKTKMFGFAGAMPARAGITSAR